MSATNNQKLANADFGQSQPLSFPSPKDENVLYFAGKSESDFLHAVQHGDDKAQQHAANIILSQQYIHPDDADIYIALVRPAIHHACRLGAMSPATLKKWRKIEENIFLELLSKGLYSEPSNEQAEAFTNIPHQKRILKEVFHIDAENYYLEFDLWPSVPPPAKLIKKVCTRGGLPCSMQEQLCNGSRSLLMYILHAEEEDFSGISQLHQIPEDYLEKPCYFFGRENKESVDWLIAPFAELKELCGLIIAADGSFYCICNEWNNHYGIIFT